MLRRLLLIVVLLVVLAGLYVAGAWFGLYGRHEGAGEPVAARIPESVVTERESVQRSEAAALTIVPPPKQVLFGDLHVHSTFSSDAFLGSLPFLQGEGAHPISDACDYARFCSALDFWSINDHAEASTPQRWAETKDAIRQCNALAGDPANPDVTAFLGWEWSQVGATPDEHYGHKNVVLRDLADDAVPARPIGAAGLATDALRNAGSRIPRLLPLLDFVHQRRYWNFLEFVDEIAAVPPCPADLPSDQLPADCYESATTPADLFRKLAESGHTSIVIPHGNTWGLYSPPGITWDKQLAGPQHDPERQTLVEVMSGHGNSEEYRDWRAVVFDAAGKPQCPEPTPDYLPSCWRAGEIIAERCAAEGLPAEECGKRAADARQYYAEAGVAGHLAVPGVKTDEWLDSGQCRDCFLPSFNYRPGGSSQYALAISNFDALDANGDPRRFHWGFIASSDNHQARPGTGYKEFGRHGNTESRGPRNEAWRERLQSADAKLPPVAQANPVDLAAAQQRGLGVVEAERQASFFLTGGLAAVHAEGRSRDAVWNALERREVYGTSGDRILLWFHLLQATDETGRVGAIPMGGAGRVSGSPRFEVRAVGAHVQKPGCPEYTGEALSAAEIDALCLGECYHPGDERKPITRIEVVRIRPQTTAGEPIAGLIDDPWRVFPCEPSQAGCVVNFEDPEFADAGRDSVYYVRAIEAPSPAVNADNLRCVEDESGACPAVDPCWGDYRTPADDDCLAENEERAWSSPIYVQAP